MSEAANRLNKKQRGFSLLGVIVAIFVVSVGLVAISRTVNISLKAAFSTQNKIIASGLTQEGIEIVRSLRGGPSSDWNPWFSSQSAGDYKVQYNSSSLSPYTDSFLRFDPATGLYQYSTGSTTIFKRKINITKPSANEIGVKSTVTWLEKGATTTLEVEDRLWNWK